MSQRICHIVLTALIAVGVFTPVPAIAQLPQIRLGSVFPPGSQAGTSVPITIVASTDTDEAAALIFSHPGIQAVAKTDESGNPIAGSFEVSVAETVPPGLYDVRVQGLFGISNPRAFRVDSLPETLETEPNNTSDTAQSLSLNSIVNARSNAAADVDYFTVDIAAGQTIVLKTEAAAIDSTQQPVVEVFAQNGRRIASSRRVIKREAALVVTSVQDQRLTIKIHDVVFAGADTFNYRLIVDDRPQVDFSWPPVIPSGAAGFVEVYGRHLPGGEPTDMQLDGLPLYRKAIAVPAAVGGRPTMGEASAAALTTVLWNALPGNLVQLAVCEPGIAIYRDSDPIIRDGRSLTGPFTVAGRFERKNSDDTIRFFAKKDEIRDIEVVSQRLGFPTNARLIVERLTFAEDGTESVTHLATTDVGPQDPGGSQLPTFTRDPAYRLTAPEDGLYQIRIRNLYAGVTAQPNQLYVVNIREPQPNFQLIAFEALPSADGQAPPDTGSINVRKGGRYEVPVYVLRQAGHNAPITVTMERLPEGVTCRPSVIPPGQSTTRLVLDATEDAPETTSPITIEGRTEGQPVQPARTATLVHAGINGLPRTGRLAATAMLHVMKDVQAFHVNIEPEAISVKPGEQQAITLRLTRRNGFNNKVDVTFTGLPANVEIPGAAFEPDVTEATVQLNAKENAAAGDVQILTYATATVPYRRNPWKAERAHAVVTSLQQQLEPQQAAQSTAQAAKEAAAAELQQATDAIASLQEQEKSQTATLAALTEQLIAATSEATSVPDGDVPKTDSSLSTPDPGSTTDVLAIAATALAAVPEELKTSAPPIAELIPQLEAAQSALMATRNEQQSQERRHTELQTKVAETDKALADITAVVEQLTAQKTAAEQAAAAADEATKPADVNVRLPSAPVALQIRKPE